MIAVRLAVRALGVLHAVADSDGGLSLQDLVTNLDVPLGSMHRLLSVLEEERYLSRSPTNRRYFLGPASLYLAVQGERLGLRGAPHPIVSDLAQKSKQTVFLTEMLNGSAVCSALTAGRNSPPLFARVGQEMPVHAAASARVLLSYENEGAVRHMLDGRPLTPFTSKTPTSVGVVLDRVMAARERGYDVCEDELDSGVWAVAAPIRASTGVIQGSLTLVTAAHEVADTARRERLLSLLVAGAARVSSDLGWSR